MLHIQGILIQFRFKDNYIPLVKFDNQQHPYEMFYYHHGFALGEPNYANNNDLPYINNQPIPYMTNGLVNAASAGGIKDYWNAGADATTTNGGRQNSIFQWVNDDPFLYDHEFQESPLDVAGSDLMVDYQYGIIGTSTPAMNGNTINFNFFLIYGNIVRVNEILAEVQENAQAMEQ